MALIVTLHGSTDAYADIASGTSGTCDWVIDDNGKLTISPTNGVEGTLGTGAAYTSAPWCSNASAITSVEFAGTVHAQTCRLFFSGCYNLAIIDFPGFDTSSVTDMSYMFDCCTSLSWLDFDGFDTSSVTDMSGMFDSCYNLTDLYYFSFDTSSVTNMSYMFNGCSGLTSLDVSGFDTSSVTNMSNMFYGCSGLTSLDVSGFDTSSVTDMSNMFCYCSDLTSLDVSGFDTSSVTNMSGMFSDCSSLTSLDLSDFDTSAVTTMSSMFSNCSSLTSLDLSSFDTSSVTDMRCMFSGCSGLTSLDVSSFNTSLVSNMDEMFYYCDSLISLDLSNFNTSRVTSMNSMFDYCISLTRLNISNFDTSKCFNISHSNKPPLPVNIQEVNYSSQIDKTLVLLPDCHWSRLSDGRIVTTKSISGSETYVRIQRNAVAILYEDGTFVFQLGSEQDSSHGAAIASYSSFEINNYTSATSVPWNNNRTKVKKIVFKDILIPNKTSYWFYNCSNCASMDLANLDTSNVTTMAQMFTGCSKLEEVDLGTDFSFKGNNITSAGSQAVLPTPPTATTTRMWIREDETYGPYTSEELRNNYTSAMAGKWIWQERPTEYTLNFVGPAEATGSMPPQKLIATEAGTINKAAFMWFDHSFDHWEASDGNTYEDEATIPANTYAVGDVITLTAVMTQDNHEVQMENGEFTFTIHGGEKATFSGIPAGTAYQVYEETPDGWVLIESSNVSGIVESLGTSEVNFLNQYQEGATTVSIIGIKTIDGKAAPSGAYTFRLKEGGSVLQTITNSSGGLIQFDAIRYTETGTHTYTVEEVAGNDNTIDYDRHTETVTVSVTEDENHNLHATASYDADGIRFANRTKPGALEIRKIGQGVTEANEDTLFYFKVTLKNPDGTLIAGGDYYWYVVDENGNIVTDN